MSEPRRRGIEAAWRTDGIEAAYELDGQYVWKLGERYEISDPTGLPVVAWAELMLPSGDLRLVTYHLAEFTTASWVLAWRPTPTMGLFGVTAELLDRYTAWRYVPGTRRPPADTAPAVLRVLYAAAVEREEARALEEQARRVDDPLIEVLEALRETAMAQVAEVNGAEIELRDRVEALARADASELLIRCLLDEAREAWERDIDDD